MGCEDPIRLMLLSTGQRQLQMRVRSKQISFTKPVHLVLSSPPASVCVAAPSAANGDQRQKAGTAPSKRRDLLAAIQRPTCRRAVE